MSRSGNKYLIYGLVVTLQILFLLHSTVNGKKLIFCKHCLSPSPRNVAFDQQTTILPGDTTILTSNIIRAPSKCKPDEVLDHRGKCRRLIYGG